MGAPASTAKVFVVQEGNKDYSTGYKFGELDVLATGEIQPVPLTVSPQNFAIVERMSAKLRDYIPGRDYILLMGSPIAMVWVSMLLIDRFGRAATHKFLKWDNFSREYAPYVVSLPDLDHMEQRGAVNGQRLEGRRRAQAAEPAGRSVQAAGTARYVCAARARTRHRHRRRRHELGRAHVTLRILARRGGEQDPAPQQRGVLA